MTIAALVAWLALVGLANADRDVATRWVDLGDEVPATLTVPGDPDDFGELPDAPPADERPPLIVLGHGFTADRVMMSSLARSFASAGYPVLSFDFDGHGSNPNPFPGGVEGLLENLSAAVDWAETTPYGDPERIVVMGHSMGAGAALEFATRDDRPAAVVPISGGSTLEGPEQPQNVLFAVAERDAEHLRDRARDKAEELAGVDEVVDDETYGDIADGTGVRYVTIGGVDHGTILWSGGTVDEIVAWLDEVFGIERSGSPGLDDGRLGPSGLYVLALLVLLAGLGALTARLAPQPVAVDASWGSLWSSVGVLVAALVVAAPLASTASPAGFLSLAAGDSMLGYLAMAGALVLVLGALIVGGHTRWATAGWLRVAAGGEPSLARAIVVGALGFAAVFVLMLPLGVTFHRLVPTPPRLVLAILASAAVLPFTLAFARLFRRGGVLRSSVVAVVARIVLLVVVTIGAVAGLLPGVIQVITPILGGLYVLVEVFSIAAYKRGVDPRVLAVVEAAWLGWLTAVTMPVT